MKPLQFSILGLGAWGLNFRNADQLASVLRGESLEDDGAKGPKPEIIPANERRRAPLPVRLAVESSWQACQNAGLDPADLACVFVSGLGDTQLTDYMCKVLAGENKSLSPTKFHNSVHNAAAGYWTISTGCMHAANSVAGYQHSVPLTLMEGLLQAELEQRPILLTFYDAPVSPVLKPLLKNEHAFAVSMIVASGATHQKAEPSYLAEVVDEAGEWPNYDWSESIQNCYGSNPVARILSVVQFSLADQLAPLTMPLSEQRALQLRAA